MILNQVTVPTLNVEMSIAFYELLGLKLIVKSLPHYARFECRGGSTFSIKLTDQLPTGTGISVYFECDQLDAEVERLIAAGVAFDELPTGKPWLWREASIKDPDGNHIILYYAGSNRLYPPWRIGGVNNE